MLSCNDDNLLPAQKNNEAVDGTVQVDTSKTKANYTNFSRITGTPEEIIIDLGLNAEPFGAPKDPIAIDQRIVMSFYTAKKFATALQLTIQRHEASFGPIETDARKRLVK